MQALPLLVVFQSTPDPWLTHGTSLGPCEREGKRKRDQCCSAPNFEQQTLAGIVRTHSGQVSGYHTMMVILRHDVEPYLAAYTISEVMHLSPELAPTVRRPAADTLAGEQLQRNSM